MVQRRLLFRPCTFLRVNAVCREYGEAGACRASTIERCRLIVRAMGENGVPPLYLGLSADCKAQVTFFVGRTKQLLAALSP